jgi:hypothetical protein
MLLSNAHASFEATARSARFYFNKRDPYRSNRKGMTVSMIEIPASKPQAPGIDIAWNI